MSYVLGIDLGTTNVAAAVRRDDTTQPVVLELGDRTATVPSVVHLQEDGTLSVGDVAERRAVTEPERVAREVKRRLGDPIPVILGGSPFGAPALMAAMAKHVVQLATQRQGAPPRHIVLTHPGNWGPWKLEQLRLVAELAGIGGATFVSEPEAAALHFAHRERIEPGQTVAVYDLGGGTFDASVLRRTADGYQVAGEPRGIEHLGGMDFDQALFTHVLRLESIDLEALDGSDPIVRRELAALRASCVLAKEALSSDVSAVVPVTVAGRRSDLRITRSEFEDLIRPTVAMTVDSLREAVVDAGVQPAELHAVLLAGGSSRVPLIAALIGHELGRPVAVDVHAKHTVALGATLAAPVAGDAAAPAPPIPPVPVDATSGADPSADRPPPSPPPTASLTEGPSPGRPPGSPSDEAPQLPTSVYAAGAPPLPPRPPGAGISEPFVPPPRPARRRRFGLIAAAVAVVAVIASLGTALVLRDAAGATEVWAEPAASPGPNPFTPPTTPAASLPVPTTTTPTSLTTTTGPPTTTTASTGAVTSRLGDSVGLYGGSLSLSVCDVAQLKAFLAQTPDKAQAWAAVQGIAAASIPSFVDGLTPVVLLEDVRVTNHGFADGRATPRQAILQRGTAVLVDNRGVPRVRCYCGNPLREPQPVTPKLVGQPWPGLDTAKVTRIAPAPQPIEKLALVDLTTGQIIPVTVGSASTVSTPATPVASVTTAPAPTTTAPPTTRPVTTTSRPPTTTAAAQNLTATGALAASSTFGGDQFPAGLALDGDRSTSWFSAGPRNGTSVLTFTLPAARTIERIEILNNELNATRAFRTGFGFGNVTVEVRNGGQVTFSSDQALPGTPDPDVELAVPGAVGTEIRLTFTGHEDATCGGISELVVWGR